MKDAEGLTIEGPVTKEELVSELKVLLLKAGEKDRLADNFTSNEMILRKSNELKGKYPDYTNYEMYHVLVGSNLVPCTKFDFPGDDSVEKFIRTL